MPTESETHRPLSWPTIIFIFATTIGALLWPVYAYFYGVTAGEIALAVVYFVATGMSITVGYHRLIAHRSFECAGWVRAALLIVGSAAWQSSAAEWASDHIRHHGYTDTPKDPYNIKQGVWHAHIGWLFRRREYNNFPAFLADDPLVMFQHRYYIPLAVTTSFVVPYLIAGWGGLLLAGVVRIVLGHHVTWLVNSWAHLGGSRPYNPSVSAADNWAVALFTFGEGWHNYHHTFPSDYRNGVSTWAWDPSKWLVWTMSKLGMAWDLKRISPVTAWGKRVTALIEHAGDDLETLADTRAALEKQVEETRVRLEKLLADSLDMEQAAQMSLRDLRSRASDYIQETQEAVSDAGRRRLERVREQLEGLDAYSVMLERLNLAESEVAASA